MEFTATQIPDVIVIDPVVYEDARGFFMETWQEKKFRDAGIDARFVQGNHSRSSIGVLRGLHYQVSQAQGKLIRVIQGEAFDVAVDIRKSSPTFGRWVGAFWRPGSSSSVASRQSRQERQCQRRGGKNAIALRAFFFSARASPLWVVCVW